MRSVLQRGQRGKGARLRLALLARSGSAGGGDGDGGGRGVDARAGGDQALQLGSVREVFDAARGRQREHDVIVPHIGDVLVGVAPPRQRGGHRSGDGGGGGGGGGGGAAG